MTESQILIPDELIQTIKNSKRITILTGAGVSSESGIPTFRESRTGLWEIYQPEDLATPEAFQKNPQLVWDWYSWRLNIIRKAEPNPGHKALADFQNKYPELTLITQNVDGLHQRAGSQQIIELHGNIHRARCIENNHIVEVNENLGGLPRCPDCKSLLRPDVVWFGETLPETAFQAALTASRNSDLFFSIGTSSIIEPAASLPYEALRAGALIVEINPQPTPLTVYASYYFPLSAGIILPALIQKV